MSSLPNMRREMRYGIPAADQVIFNREYSIGYSYYFRQAKWALEIVDKDNKKALTKKETIDRLDTFRSDFRIPQKFRADKVDYKNSNYDRGHLVCSADKNSNVLENSETFLLTNMCPQSKTLNRDKWRILEELIREYDKMDEIFETFVICGPIFYFDQEVKTIGSDDTNDVTIPIPHAFYKSILAEDNKGNLNIWSFIFPNQEEKLTDPIKSYLVTTEKVEKYSGLYLWDDLKGTEIESAKSEIKSADWLKDK
jgi:endonuclease G, mitochondrial